MAPFFKGGNSDGETLCLWINRPNPDTKSDKQDDAHDLSHQA